MARHHYVQHRFYLSWLQANTSIPGHNTYLRVPHSRCRCCRAPLQRCWLVRTCLHRAPLSAPPGSSCCLTQRRWQNRMTPRTSSFCNIHQDWWCISSAGCTHWSLSGPADSFHQQGCSIAAAAAADCCCGPQVTSSKFLNCFHFCCNPLLARTWKNFQLQIQCCWLNGDKGPSKHTKSAQSWSSSLLMLSTGKMTTLCTCYKPTNPGAAP